MDGIETLSDGHLYSAEVARVVECIREYSPKLDVKFIPRELRAPGDSAFAITELLPSGQEVVAFYVDKEEDMNLSVLQRVYAADGSKQDVQKRIEKANAARKHLDNKRAEDEIAEATEKAYFLWKTSKSSVKMDGKRIDL